MADAYAQLNTIKLYYRRLYGDASTQSLTSLKARAAAIISGALEPVTITATGSELGSASGMLRMDPTVELQAIEELLLEIDPSANLPPVRGSIVDFGQRFVET